MSRARTCVANDVSLPPLPALFSALRHGDAAGIEAALGTLTDLPAFAVTRICRTASPEALAVVCRALDLKRLLFAAVYARLHATGSYDEFARSAQFRCALIQFNRLPANRASQILESWRKAPVTVWQQPATVVQLSRAA